MSFKKTAFLIASFLLSHWLIGQITPPDPYASNVSINYIRTWETVKPVTNPTELNTSTGIHTARMTTQYFDGLGRVIQVVTKQGSLPTGDIASDLVSAIVYDEFGRELYQYLPFAANNTGGNASVKDGLFKLNPFQQQATFVASQFPGETYFYGKTNYEPSPLNRIASKYAPGNSWSGSENAVSEDNRHGIATEYRVNMISDSVRIWQVNSSGISSSTMSYPAGELFKTVTIDEHKKKIIEYKTKEGVLVLRKVQLASTPGTGYTGWLCTYYVYDDLDNLRLIIPPKAVKMLASTNWSLSQNLLDELCFRYEYDSRKRAIVKKIPGAAEVRMVYDKRDRMVLSQDGNQRSAHQWLYTRYDGLNRRIRSGILTDPTNYNNHSWHQQQAMSEGNPLDYPTLSSYTYEALTATFYDNYAWLGDYGNPLTSTLDTDNSAYLLTASDTQWPYPQAVEKSTATVGLLTGARVKVLGSSDWIYSVTLYDKNGKAVQVKTKNKTGGIDVTTTQFSWSGKPLLMIQKTAKAGINAQTMLVLTKIQYDALFRDSVIQKKVSASFVKGGSMPSEWMTTARMEYNAAGKMRKKVLSPAYNGSGLESLSYDYNIRGWLIGMNRKFIKDSANNYFGYDLGYDNTSAIVSGSNYVAPQFNGNISGTTWKSKGDGEKRKYDYGYDATNRLLKADFNQYAAGSFNKTAGFDFSVLMGNGIDPDSAYDYNGNILRLQQWGLKGVSSTRLDDLRYTYYENGNKLKNVLDLVNDTATRLGDFRSSKMYMTALGNVKSTTAIDYTYDDNANLKKDMNKDITDDTYDGIEYNYLGQPVKIRIKNKGTIECQYDATGNKLTKTIKETGLPDKIYQYLGNNLFVNDTLQSLSHEEGRIRPVGDSLFVYDYYIKDHLGSVRAVITMEEQPVSAYHATIEATRRTIEKELFAQIDETATDKPSGFDSDGNNSKVSKLFSSSGTDKRVGPSLLLKVMAGDTFKAGVKGWYLPGANAATVPGANSIVPLLANLFIGSLPAGVGKSAATSTSGSAALAGSLLDFITTENNGAGSKPKAYLNWMVLDEQLFSLVDNNYGAVQIPEITGTMQRQLMLAEGGTEIEVKKNGYLYVYVSNESQGNVYFDDLFVTHTQGQLLEEAHYYPSGLTMAGISTKSFGKPLNKIQFSGKEKQHKEFSDGIGLEWYDFGARMYDPQLARWFNHDKFAEVYVALTPYQYAANNPVKTIDVDGHLLKDKDGNIIATSTGIKTQESRPIPISKAEKESGVTAQRVVFEHEQVTIYTDKGTPVTAFRTVAAYIETTMADGTVTTTASAEAFKKENLDVSANCHGYTFAGGNIWIADDLEKVIADEYNTDNISLAGADVAIVEWTYPDGSKELTHSGKPRADGKFDHDDDVYRVEKGASESRFLEGHRGENYGASTSVKGGKKTSESKRSNTQAGVVVNGVRITDQKELEKIFKELGIPLKK